MRLRGILTAFAAMLLLAGMFVAVHRGARGREIAERITQITDREEAAQVQKSELEQEIELLRSRPRLSRAAERLGLHVPSDEEFVLLDLRGWAWSGTGGAP
jgi:cell division protein FtsL